MTLGDAIKINRPFASNCPRGKIAFHSNYGHHQVRIFFEAQLHQLGHHYQVEAETYNGLFPDLLSSSPSAASIHVLVVDSDTALCGSSLRNASSFYSKSPEEFASQLQKLGAAIENFAGKISGSLLLAFENVATPSLSPLAKSLAGEIEFRCTQVQALFADLALKNPKIYCLKSALSPIDQKRFVETGEPFSSEGAKDFATQLSQAAVSVLTGFGVAGEAKKLLITDLDNTFWKGLIGEVGWAGVDFSETKEGKPHFLYQKFLEALSHEGILLAVCSKNNSANVEEGFSKLQLHCPRERFSVVEVGWGPKSQAITSLLKSLNLLPSSAVFIDDQSAELEEVKFVHPEITTLQFPEKYDDVFTLFETLRPYFEKSKPGGDSAAKLKNYSKVVEVNQTLEKLKSSNGKQDYAAYLLELKMNLTLQLIEPAEHSRALELLNKTNQFNLTGKRYTEEEFEFLLKNGAVYTAKLKDRLSDYGVIGVVMMEKLGNQKVITQMVLSCRVFSRNVEDAILEKLLPYVSGVLLAKTPKNQPTLEFFSRVLPKNRNVLSDKPTVQKLEPKEAALEPFRGKLQGFSTINLE